MDKILEILRLKFEHGLSGRAIALAVCAALSTVQECLRRFAASGLGWPVTLDETALEALLYPRAAFKPLPATPYEFAQWKRAKLQLDYHHVEVDQRSYSVPHQHVGKTVNIRISAHTRLKSFCGLTNCQPSISVRSVSSR